MRNILLSSAEKHAIGVIQAVNAELLVPQTCRIAGGWVRDKLLGEPTTDMDISLDSMSGLEFARHIIRYGRKHPEAKVGKLYVVEQNAAKSKHLQTAALEIGDFSGDNAIDFVNLRTETYASDSRVPEAKLGTPECDALRRDFTINGLFYNIATGRIEDFVEGYNDLMNPDGIIIRSPMPASQMLSDDPLRAMRALRFYSIFEGSKLSDDLVDALKSKALHDSWHKVSPERIGKEMYKLLLGRNRIEALRLFVSSGLDRVIFKETDYSGLADLNMNQQTPYHDFTLLDHTMFVMMHFQSFLESESVTAEDLAAAMFAAFAHDLGKAAPGIQTPHATEAGRMSYPGHEVASAEICQQMLDLIGWKSRLKKLARYMTLLHMEPHGSPFNRRRMRRFSLQAEQMGLPSDYSVSPVRLTHLLAMADSLAKRHKIDEEDLEIKRINLQKHEEFMNEPEPAKPFLNGRDLMEMFPHIDPKSGFIRHVIDSSEGKLIREQDAGRVSDREEAVDFVESLRAEIEELFA